MFTRSKSKLFRDVSAHHTCNVKPALQHLKRIRNDLCFRRGMRFVELFVEQARILREQKLRQLEFARTESIFYLRSEILSLPLLFCLIVVNRSVKYETCCCRLAIVASAALIFAVRFVCKVLI